MILFSRPISTGLVVWTIIIALLLVALVELLQRPADEVAAADAAAAAASEEAEAAASAEAADADDGPGDTAVLDDELVGPTGNGSDDGNTAVLVEASGAELEGGVAEDAKATDVLDLGGDVAPKPTGPKKRGRPAE